MFRRSLLFFLVVMMLLTGCSVTEDYVRPHVPVPSNWRILHEAEADLLDSAWWNQFNDPVLNVYIAVAISNNRDVKTALARVEEYMGRLQTRESARYPNVEYGFDASRDKQPENTSSDLIEGGDISNSYVPALSMHWELDIWGRLARANEAARAELLSVEEIKKGVIMTLVTTVATVYIDILHLDKQLQITEETLKQRQVSVELFETQFKGGHISELELAQVRHEAILVAAKIPLLKREIAHQENALSLLLGTNPGNIKRGMRITELAVPRIPKGLPSELLAQRPDIRQAEQNLIVASANLQVAKTLYYPSISLTGIFGYSSDELSNLFKKSSSFFSIGSGLVGPLFDGWAIEGTIEQARSIKQQLVQQYLKTIETAFKEVNDVLASYKHFNELYGLEEKQLRISKDYAYYANKRYEAGYARYLEVLDGERSHYTAQLNHVQTRRDILVVAVRAYKAMGGSWIEKAEQQITQKTQK
jgi:multidrug efflux system outer membrane protein